MRWLGLAVLLAILLRFPTLGQQSFWTDEASTALELHGGLGHLLASVRDLEGMPPGYFVLAWLWSRVFGLGEAGLRSLSACLGVATVPVAWALARELRPGAAPLAAGLVATSPFLVWYSQEARPYALLVLVTALMTLFWVQGRTTAWGLAAAAALLVHYFAIFLIVPQAIVLLRRGTVRPLLIPAATGLALAPLILSQADARVDWVTDTSLLTRIGDVAKHFASGEFGASVNLLGFLAIVILAYGALRRRGPVLAVAAVAGVLPVLVALVGPDYVLDRYVIATLVPLLAVVAAGLPRPVGVALAVLFTGFTINVWTDPGLQREDWRGFARQLPQPAFVVASQDAWRPLQWYGRGRVEAASAPHPVRDVVAVAAYRTGRRRPQTPGPPAAFANGRRADRETLSVVRYRAGAPQLVDPRGLLTQNLDTRTVPRFLYVRP